MTELDRYLIFLNRYRIFLKDEDIRFVDEVAERGTLSARHEFMLSLLTIRVISKSMRSKYKPYRVDMNDIYTRIN